MLEKKNIFPSLPVKKSIIFIPIIIDQNENEIKMFSDNIIYKLWNSNIRQYDLLNYILTTEDLEDLNLVKNNLKNLENFEFNEIVKKYNLEDYIVSIFFKGPDQITLLNKIRLDKKKL